MYSIMKNKNSSHLRPILEILRTAHCGAVAHWTRAGLETSGHLFLLIITLKLQHVRKCHLLHIAMFLLLLKNKQSHTCWMIITIFYKTIVNLLQL